MKLLVTTSAFTAGAVIDEKTGLVRDTDHWLAHLRGLTEEAFRQHCAKQGWGVSEKSD